MGWRDKEPKDKPEDCVTRGGHQLKDVHAWPPFEPGSDEKLVQTGQCIHCGCTLSIENKDVERVYWELQDD